MTKSASLIAIFISISAAAAFGQSSSLFLEGERMGVERIAASRPALTGPLPANAGVAAQSDPNVNAALNNTSFMAVPPAQPRLFRVHDAVTIVVLEAMRYRSDNQFQQDRRWDIAAKLSKWFRISDDKLVAQDFQGGIPEVKLESNDRRTGNGRQNRQDEFTTRITGEVIDVKPNGQLVIQATRKISYEEDSQVVTLVGRCRGEDVTAANTVFSTQLIDLSVDTRTDGKTTDAAGRGWLQKAFDKIRPF